jgi:pimeloyl-ACP methyl ester carboxylesterase
MDILLKHDIPILLVCGDSDETVPYEENGKVLKDYCESHGGKIKTFLKKDCGHHPHGLENYKLAVDIIEEFTK